MAARIRQMLHIVAEHAEVPLQAPNVSFGPTPRATFLLAPTTFHPDPLHICAIVFFCDVEALFVLRRQNLFELREFA